MTEADSQRFPEFVAKLSDGALSESDARLLNALLQSDPIAQEQYLDHMLVDGLLEREFGGAPHSMSMLVTDQGEQRAAAPAASRRTRWAVAGRRFLPMGMAMVFIACGWLWLRMPFSPEQEVQPLSLVNSGFERGKSLQADAVSQQAWHGDEGDVVSRFSDVVPLEGHRMLRFVKSKDEPEEMCELYQIVDLRDLADEISRHATSVEASAFFNGISVDIPDDEFSFGITVFAFSEDPSEQSQLSPLRWENALTFSGSRTPADADEESWQKVITTLPLPPDTRYLVVQLGVIRTDPDESDDVFPGQFVDKVSVNLICQK